MRTLALGLLLLSASGARANNETPCKIVSAEEEKRRQTAVELSKAMAQLSVVQDLMDKLKNGVPVDPLRDGPGDPRRPLTADEAARIKQWLAELAPRETPLQRVAKSLERIQALVEGKAEAKPAFKLICGDAPAVDLPLRFDGRQP